MVFGKRSRFSHTDKQGWTWVMEEEKVILPEDGRYLVCDEPIEFCPMCYAELDISGFSFNTSNWLISVVCDECSLTIIFRLKPPDGRDHKVTILSD